MTIGITGARGFIARHIIAALEEKGVSVVPFSREQGDLTEKSETLQMFADASDIVIHTAAVHKGSERDIIAGTLLALFNLLSALRARSGKSRLFFLSSIQAETDSTFGLSKRLAERVCREFGEHNGSPVTLFRLPNIFGPGCKPFYNSVVATFCHQVARGEALSVSKNPTKIPFLHVGDVIEALLERVNKPVETLYEEITLCHEETLTVSELADIIRSFAGVSEMTSFPSPFRKKLYATYRSYVA